MPPARFGTRALLCAGLALQAACTQSTARGAAPGDLLAVRRWLLCEECSDGQLDSLLLGSRRDRVVPVLARAIEGPPLRGREYMRRQLEETYEQLAARAVERGETLSVAREQYIGHFLSNYEARYQSRAVTGLAAIGTPEARRALTAAMDRVRTGEAVHRGDVIEELSRAVGAAASAAKLGWITITAGASHTCAIRTDSAAYCWGANFSGQVGDGTEVTRRRPARVRAPPGFTAIAAAPGGEHTCGILRGKVYCWGRNTDGQLGDGTTTSRQFPLPVRSGLGFAGLALGATHTCAWTAAGEAFCWGGNHAGQLGDGTTDNRSLLAPAAASLRFAAMTAGAAHTCGSSLKGEAYCWGENEDGQLGHGSRGRRAVPGTVLQPARLAALAAGAVHTCGLTRGAAAVWDAHAYCSGRNLDGQLGDSTQITRDSLRRVAGGRRFLMLAAGTRHTCGLTLGGREVLCWGNNDFGQLGDGTREARLTPVRARSGQRFAVVSAGEAHTCGVTVRGEAFCWGRNLRGEVGDGGDDDRVVPTRVALP